MVLLQVDSAKTPCSSGGYSQMIAAPTRTISGIARCGILKSGARKSLVTYLIS